MNKIIWPKWPIYTKEDINSVIRVVKSNQIFADKEVKKFEDNFARYNKSKYVKCVGNATQGLHLALSALEIGYGDEVIVTNYSWISTASCILMQNAKPVFVDIELDTLGIDPKKIERAITKKTKAIIVVHMFGNPCKIEEIQKIAKKRKLYLIEDASHAHGSTIKNKKVGNFSDIAVFSVHQRKNLSAGEGGVVISKNKNLDKKIYKLRSFGDRKLSYNYRMTEFCAAIGQNSLKKLNKENILRNKNIKYLNNKIQKYKLNKFYNIVMPRKKCSSTFHKLPLLFQHKFFKTNIIHFINYMNKFGIPFSKAYVPLNKHSNFNIKKKKNIGFPNIKLNYGNKKFPNTDEICLKKLTELSIHRPVDTKHLNFLIKKLNSYVKIYKLNEKT